MSRAASDRNYEYAALLRDRIERLRGFRDELVGFRGTMEGLSFVYRVPGFAGDDRIYLIRRGRIRKELQYPKGKAGRARVAEAIDEVYGELDLGPMGKHYAHTWVRKDRERYYRSGNSLLLYSVESRLSGDLVEALGRVPKVLAQGKIFRWKSGGDSILAFPENRAILVRSPGAFRDENLQEIGELRVEFDDARRVERLLERRDRVEERLEKEWQPQLEALVKEGDPAIFALW